ncbi:SPOR domain-containing protein [Chromobacterium sp. CV08]|uniref:SPOR domain-containing protein n=1 Tax=Chromobacterium sp. CV08 TaxID=3133274 RepID=UPI003DA8499B
MREQNQQQTPADGGEESDLNSKLKKRLWLAGGLVAVALAAIPLMDALTKPKQEMNSDAPSPSSGKIIKPAAVPDIAATAPATQAASAPASQSSAPAADTASHAPATPAANSPRTPDLSKTPAIANQQAATRQAAGERAAPAPAPAKTHPPSHQAQTRTASPPPAPSPSGNTAPVVANATPAAAPTASAAPATTAPPPAPAKAEPAGSSVGYQVQLGLFSSIGNAQKLVRDLQKHGISAHTVTRVQLGPFKSRAEADEAMKKLRELGYSPLLAAGQ